MQQISEYNKKAADSVMQIKKLVVTSGDREAERGKIGAGD